MSYFMKDKTKIKILEKMESDYILLRDPIKGKERVEKRLSSLEKDREKYLEEWYAFSKENGEVYPSQGLLTTPHDYLTGLSLSVGDLGASVVGSTKERTSRTERYAQGPFVKLGKSARMLFVGSALPDVWNSSSAIASMAASHCIS